MRSTKPDGADRAQLPTPNAKLFRSDFTTNALILRIAADLVEREQWVLRRRERDTKVPHRNAPAKIEHHADDVIALFHHFVGRSSCACQSSEGKIPHGYQHVCNRVTRVRQFANGGAR